MGVSDDDYAMMVQTMFRDDPTNGLPAPSMTNGQSQSQSQKRSWDEGMADDSRAGKRARFETIE
ncbi:hypothetical protein EXIGLDRAFT_726880 [Exidia glandulosa HHB12029]|uniref:Uncharacterized protein n=1 Tax=Exidia glandulosa HHB12029 TaxID=1314781 RepID=A0A165DJZ3_EXIGL|nr:hypothetical protein EXIGLDRAFT_726880 [Exidia glandulosa HHB12029]